MILALRTLPVPLLLAAAGMLPASAPAAFPDKPVRIVVPYAPGGTTDLLARRIGKRLNDMWGQSVVVENRAGGGGTVGTDIVAKANPDGYTLLLTAPAPITINPHLLKSLPYDPQRDLAPVTLLATTPSLLIAHPSLQAKSVADLLRIARTTPGKLNYASTGNGSPSHLMGVMFANAAGVRIVHVPYKGTGPALTELTGGQVQMMFNTIPAILPIVRSGRLVPLAITGPRRFEGLPDVPTMKEAGLPGVESAGWYGVLAPRGVAAPLMKRIHGDIIAALNAPEIREEFAREGATLIADTPAAFAQFIQADFAKWRKVVATSGATAD